MNAVLTFIDHRSPAALWAIATLAVCLIGLLDFYTGYELSFSVFYLMPISLASWGISRSAGFVLSIASALADGSASLADYL
jgi:hypothetical protein